MIRAILFDFDGTLVDSYAAIAASANFVRGAHGLPPLPQCEVRRHVGLGLPHLLKQVVPGIDMEQGIAMYRGHHRKICVELTRLLPGALTAVHDLHKRGISLAVCSNKPVEFTRMLVDSFGLRSLFELVIGPEDVSRPKPAPDMLLKALKHLSILPSASVYIGDMKIDVETARAAGIRVWAVPTGSESIESLRIAGPDAIMESLAFVPGLVENARISID